MVPSGNFSSILKNLFSCEGFFFFFNSFPILRWSSPMTQREPARKRANA